MTQLTTNVPSPSLQGTAFVQQGVTDTSLANSIQSLGSLVGNIVPSQKQRETTAQRSALGGFANDLLNLEEEEAQVQQQLFDLQNQITNSTDQKAVQDLRQQYVRLVQAEQSGANPQSIAARKRALLRNNLVANPHLTQDINRVANLIDGQVEFGPDENDPVLGATNEMLKRAAQGITVDMQLEAARLNQEKQISETELILRRNTGALVFPDMFNDATQQSNDFAIQLNQQMLERTADPEFAGLNAEQQKLAIEQQMNAFVSQNMQRYTDLARSGNITLTADQMRALQSNLQGKITAQMFPIISQLDKGVQVQKQSTLLQNELNIARQTGLKRWIDMNESNRQIDIISGGDAQVRQNLLTSYAKTLSAMRRSPGTATQFAAVDPTAGMFAVMMDKTPEQFVQHVQQITANPQGNLGAMDGAMRQVVANSIAGATPETAEGKEAEAAKLPVAFFGQDSAATRQLLTDQVYNKVVGNKHLSDKVVNLANSEVVNIARNLAEIVSQNNGKVVFAEPEGPIRIAQGNGRYEPAQALRLELEGGGLGSTDAVNAMRKLNTLYALMVGSGNGAIAKQWAQETANTFDSEATDYNIRELEELRTSMSNRMASVRGRPNYATEEQRQNELDGLQRSITDIDRQIKSLKGERVEETPTPQNGDE